MYAWEHEIRPSDILSQSSFENVVRYMMATGGSTNSLLHIPALARQADFDITPETFDAISREVPLLSTIYPNHPTYTMEDFDAAGGIGAVVKELAAAGKIDTDAKGMFGTIGDKAARAENKTTTSSTPWQSRFTSMAVWLCCTATSAPTAPLSSSAPWIPPHGSSAVPPSATTRRTTHGTPF